MKLPEYLPINNCPGYIRQTSSMGVINVDTNARNKYIAQRDKIRGEKQKIAAAMQEIECLKVQVAELTRAVSTLLNTK